MVFQKKREKWKGGGEWGNKKREGKRRRRRRRWRGGGVEGVSPYWLLDIPGQPPRVHRVLHLVVRLEVLVALQGVVVLLTCLEIVAGDGQAGAHGLLLPRVQRLRHDNERRLVRRVALAAHSLGGHTDGDVQRVLRHQHHLRLQRHPVRQRDRLLERHPVHRDRDHVAVPDEVHRAVQRPLLHPLQQVASEHGLVEVQRLGQEHLPQHHLRTLHGHDRASADPRRRGRLQHLVGPALFLYESLHAFTLVSPGRLAPPPVDRRVLRLLPRGVVGRDGEGGDNLGGLQRFLADGDDGEGRLLHLLPLAGAQGASAAHHVDGDAAGARQHRRGLDTHHVAVQDGAEEVAGVDGHRHVRHVVRRLRLHVLVRPAHSAQVHHAEHGAGAHALAHQRVLAQHLLRHLSGGRKLQGKLRRARMEGLAGLRGAALAGGGGRLPCSKRTEAHGGCCCCFFFVFCCCCCWFCCFAFFFFFFFFFFF
eukprot:Rhum_TRINITY_DN183_c0_g1::Rhum_TRINITY_DN183_c0_g1_i1::g.605::m.605